ncbi:MAG: peroxiredoxin-like family protein [Acetobacteraceae bacterium]
MSLQAELDAFREAFIRTAPPGRAELYDAKVDALRLTFPIEAALKEGDLAPDFALPDASGMPVALSDRLRAGPVVLIFYRGGWCPYCNLQLRAYQHALDEITALGGQLLAVSPQLPDGSLSTAEMNKLSFGVLSDVSNRVAKTFGLVYALPDELRAALRSNGKALPGINGDDSWELPLPATYVIAPDRSIVLAAVELDYRERQAPEGVVAALRSLASHATQAA